MLQLKKVRLFCLLVLVGFLTLTGCEKTTVSQETEITKLSQITSETAESITEKFSPEDLNTELISRYLEQIRLAKDEDDKLTLSEINSIGKLSNIEFLTALVSTFTLTRQEILESLYDDAFGVNGNNPYSKEWYELPLRERYNFPESFEGGFPHNYKQDLSDTSPEVLSRSISKYRWDGQTTRQRRFLWWKWNEYLCLRIDSFSCSGTSIYSPYWRKCHQIDCNIPSGC